MRDRSCTFLPGAGPEIGVDVDVGADDVADKDHDLGVVVVVVVVVVAWACGRHQSCSSDDTETCCFLMFFLNEIMRLKIREYVNVV